jgi:hypothetical protein
VYRQKIQFVGGQGDPVDDIATIRATLASETCAPGGGDYYATEEWDDDVLSPQKMKKERSEKALIA